MFSNYQGHICSGVATMQAPAEWVQRSLYSDKTSFRTRAHGEVEIPDDISSRVPLQLNILLQSIETRLLTFLVRCTAYL